MNIETSKSKVFLLLSAITKLICFVLLLIAILYIDSVLGLTIFFLGLAFTLLFLKAFSKNIFYSVKGLKIFILVIFFMNFFFFSPETAFLKAWIFTPSYLGAIQGLKVILRFVLVIIISSLLIHTSAPIEFMDSIIFILQPLIILGIRIDIVALVLSISFRFIPIIHEQIETIKKAQIARGAKFESKKLTEKAKAYLPLIIPVFVTAFKSADDLSLAIEARGFNIERKKVKRKTFKIRGIDIIAILICAIVLTLTIYF